jgi:type IV pilus assembly protein PilW
MPSLKHRNTGVTLTEMMVAMTLGLMLTSVASSIYLNQKKTFRSQDGLSRMEENARYAIHKITHDARMAGFRGCLSTTDPAQKPIGSTLTTPTAYAYSFNSPIQGYHAVGTNWFPGLDASISGAVPAPITGSDVLTLRMASGQVLSLAATMASSTAALSVNLPANPGINAGDIALVSDCISAVAFQATAVTAGSPGTITHTATGLNASADLARAFGPDAIVMPVTTTTYYVGPSSSAPTGTERSLYRMVGTAAPVELLENVAAMRVLFGEDTDADAYANQYVTAENVGNLANVVAIRIDFLLQTATDNLTQKSGAYLFNGALTQATDHRLRRWYSTTITLRNRTL